MKLQKLSIKSKLLVAGALVVVLMACGGVAKAFDSVSFIDKVADRVANLLVGGEKQSDEILGAANRSIQYVYDYVNGFYVNGSQIFDTSAAATLPSTLTVAGESQMQTVVEGGSVYTTSTVGSTTFTAAQICDNSVILMNPGLTAISVTLPTTSTLYSDCLNTDGDSKIVLVKNTTSTANSYLQLVAGTGIDLLSFPTSTPSAGDTIGTGEIGRLRFTRLGDSAGKITVESHVFHDSD